MLDCSEISPVDAVTSRALAPLLCLVEFATGVAYEWRCRNFFAGPLGGNALSFSSKFQVESFPSKFDPEARIVRIRGRSPAPK